MKKEIRWGSRTYIMGIINLTPDSFSGDGLMNGTDLVNNALAQANQFVSEGTDILDLGAESSRPDAEPVSAEEEEDRLMPVLTAILKNNLNAIISVDTYKSSVAESALRAGADWINDIWGLRYDPSMAQIAAKYKAPVVIMHNGRELKPEAPLSGNEKQKDIINRVKSGLLECINIAQEAGIQKENVILDPGIGFGKTVEDNLALINRLDEIKTMGHPVLIGPSRKSFIGATLNLTADQRLEGTAAAIAISITRGADIIRVHDVKAMLRVARMCDAILNQKRKSI
jgi:dihydropteroate synthase